MSDTQDTDPQPTPGPWRLPYSGDPLILQDSGVILAESDGHDEPILVAEVNLSINEGTDAPGSCEANAKLIAAAPLLKAQLYNLVQEAEDAAECLEEAGMGGPAGMLRAHIQDAKTALASAEGSGDE